MNYKELATTIVENVGGVGNIDSVTHCMTRLRFVLKDVDKANKEKLNAISEVVGVVYKAGQFQLIIGQQVAQLYKVVCEEINIEEKPEISVASDQKKKFSFSSIIDGISGCLTPIIPIVTGAGMLKVVLIFATMSNILSTESSTYQVLFFASEAGFYFLPVFLGATAANKFKTSMPLGMLMGAILISPTFVSAVAEGTAMSIFGLPIYLASYTSSIFPIIMIVFIMKYVEGFFAKYSPVAVKVIMVPLCTIMVMLPLALCLIGPIGSFLGVYMAQAIMWLYNTVGFLGVALLSALYPVLVITGMHGSLFPPMIQSLTTVGYDPIIGFSSVIANINQGAATLAVAVKNKTERPNAIACSITAIFGGVTEPAMFGINLKYKTPLYAVICGGFIGGAVAGILKVYMYTLGGSAGIFGFAGFIGSDSSNLLYFFIAILVGFVSTFIITLLIYKPETK